MTSERYCSVVTEARAWRNSVMRCSACGLGFGILVFELKSCRPDRILQRLREVAISVHIERLLRLEN